MNKSYMNKLHSIAYLLTESTSACQLQCSTSMYVPQINGEHNIFVYILQCPSEKKKTLLCQVTKSEKTNKILPPQVVKGNTKKTVNSHSLLGSGEKPLPGGFCRTRVMGLQGATDHMQKQQHNAHHGMS